MRVDRVAFLAAASAIAGCPRDPPLFAPADSPPTCPSVSPAPISTAPVVPSATSIPSAPSAAPAPDATAAQAASEARARMFGFVEGLRAGGACVEQRHGPRPPRAEGTPVILDDLAKQCTTMESIGPFPTSCDEGALGCSTVVNTMTAAVGTRVLACLRAPRTPVACGKVRVEDCLLPIVASTPPQARFEMICHDVADTCADKGHTLAVEDCERYLGAMRKCHGFERAMTCLPDACDLRACVDDWVSTWSY